MSIITFNTGRGYSDKGQRVAAKRLPDGRVMFADVDRNIDGITKDAYPYATVTNSIMQNFVMREYDHGRINYGYYSEPHTEWESLAESMTALKDAAKAL